MSYSDITMNDLRVVSRWLDQDLSEKIVRPAAVDDLLSALEMEGQRVWWCEEHQGRWGYNPNCGWSPRGVPCPKVSKLLIDPPTEEAE